MSILYEVLLLFVHLFHIAGYGLEVLVPDYAGHGGFIDMFVSKFVWFYESHNRHQLCQCIALCRLI